MTLTYEQQAILNAVGNVVRINARAGTGETTTLQMLAQKHREQRILYLVFNRKAKEEARSNFPPNVDTLTVHGLAYRHEGYKWKETLDTTQKMAFNCHREHLSRFGDVGCISSLTSDNAISVTRCCLLHQELWKILQLADLS